MSGQDIALALSLDAAEANAAIERFNANQALLGERAASATTALDVLQRKELDLARMQDQLNGGGTKYNETLKAFEQRALAAAAAARTIVVPTTSMAQESAGAATKVASLSEQFKSLGQRIQPQAAAISSISAAMGQSAGQAGKIVGAVGQVTSAFAAGGPFSAALVVGTLAVNRLTQEWEAEIDAQDRAINNRADVRMADAQHVVSERIAALKKQTGVDTGETEDEAYRRLTPAVEEATRALEKFDAAQYKGIRFGVVGNGEGRTVLEQAVAQAEKLRALEAEAARQGHEKSSDSARVGGGGKQVYNTSVFQAMEAADALLEKKNAAASAAFEFQKNTDEEALESARHVQEALDSLARDNADKIRDRLRAEDDAFYASRQHQVAIQKAANDELAAQAREYVGEATTILGDYIDARVTGEKNAEAAMAAGIMKVAGQHLIGHGVDLAGLAVVSLASGLLPIAAAQGAASAGLIAAGVGLGGVATGILHTASGGLIGSPLKEKGVNKGSGRNTRTGQDANSGEVYIFNNYGVSGPLADDQVRALERTQARANRRSMS